ncbi:MAG TPA: 50S ribosomal protein L10 [Erysipelotrichaceae bacterium]|nr:50S ribosomal protein L10 [Erysipelotrichaceae bacterium]
MSSNRILEKKQALVKEIAEKLENSASSVVVEYRGLSVAQITDLRARLREEDVEFKVYKNTMVRLAAEEAGYPDMVEHLVGPNGFAFGTDAVAPARILADFAKTHRQVVFKTGVVGGEILDVDGLVKLSKLPNKDGMLSMFIGMLQAPVRNFAYLLKAVSEAKAEEPQTEVAEAAEEKVEAVEEVKAEEVKEESQAEEENTESVEA